MISPKSLIYVAGSVFLVYGLLFAAFPNQLLRLTVDGSVTSTSALIDIRATYGGMSVAAGVILLMQGQSSNHKAGLLTVLILMIGMAVGRSIGLYVDGDANLVMYVYLLLEVVVAILALSLLRRTDRVFL